MDRRGWKKSLEFALSLPGAFEDHPWGETVAKVNKKVFTFFGTPESKNLSITVKLTESHAHALTVPDAAPSSHGLGKAGWVTIPIGGLTVDLACDWIDESYRNVAPKRLISVRETARPAPRRMRA